MSEESSAGEWLGGRGKRRVEAVGRALAVLGFSGPHDRGAGHLDNLYATAYDHAFRDAWALAARMMQDRFSDTLPGTQHLEYVVLHEQAKQAATAGAHRPGQVVMIEYRDVRPSGAVISSWECPERQESGQDYTQFGPGMVPEPPWERQRREPGGDWVTVASVREDGSVETRQPDGTMTISRTWWE